MGLLSGFRKNKIARILGSTIESDKKVLDLGCGDGAILRALKAEGTGIDIDPSRFPPDSGKINYIRHDITETLPFISNTFDFCIMSQVIEHLTPPDIEPVLKECLRILKPEGKIIILTPTPSADFILKLLALMNFIGRFEHMIYFTKDGLEKLCRKVGFRTNDMYYYNFWLNTIYIGEKVQG